MHTLTERALPFRCELDSIQNDEVRSQRVRSSFHSCVNDVSSSLERGVDSNDWLERRTRSGERGMRS